MSDLTEEIEYERNGEEENPDSQRVLVDEPKNMLIATRTMILLLLDQVSKHFSHSGQEAYWLLEDQVGVSPTLNPGIAFSLPVSTDITIPLAIVLIFYTTLIFDKGLLKGNLAKWSYCLLLAGTLGNTIDRIHIGAVIDFIKISDWPTFNLADTYLTIALLAFMMMQFRKGVSAHSSDVSEPSESNNQHPKRIVS